MIKGISLVFILCAALFSVSLSAAPRDKVQYGPVTIEHFTMSVDGYEGKVVHAQPGEKIDAFASYQYWRGWDTTINQIIVGLDQTGAQVAIYEGSSMSQGVAEFNLTAPQKPGIYEVRFRYAQAYTAEDAVHCWWDVDSSPSEKATIGIIVVDGNRQSKWAKKLSDETMEEYLVEKYPQPTNNLTTAVPLLSTEMVASQGFWGEIEGLWKIKGNTLTANPSNHYLEANTITSNQTYKDVNITFDARHKITNPMTGWSYARGYSFEYYTNDDNLVSFHYFPDVQQASLYIRDQEKDIEAISKVNLTQNVDHVHQIKITNGMIYWYIDGKLEAFNTTKLKTGKIRLISYNNETKFTF